MATHSPQKHYEVALVMLPGIGAMLAKQLVSYCGSAEQAFRSAKGKLLKIPGIGEKLADALLHSTETLKRAEAELAKAERNNATLLFYTDAAYPARLKEIADAPALLYAQGPANLSPARTLAIVGTRKATEYGRQVTEELMEGLKKYEPLIVSGLAYGIDIYAHRAALKFGLPTVGVLGSGLDVVYPQGHRGTATQMLAEGGLLTEYAFGTPPDSPHFPSRNRIIAGLADAVLVVEATNTGGALITADIADGYHREVFAVPGSLYNKASEGCLNLIKNHKAHLVTSATDLAYMMQWEEGAAPTKASRLSEAIPSHLSTEEAIVLKLLTQHKGGLHLDDIGWQSQLGVSKAAVVLLTLEFQGLVKSLPGKRYVRV